MIPYRPCDSVQSGRSAHHYFGPFRGDFSKFSAIEKHGDHTLMTDGYVFLVFDEKHTTVRWRDISENNARKYARAFGRK